MGPDDIKSVVNNQVVTHQRPPVSNSNKATPQVETMEKPKKDDEDKSAGNRQTIHHEKTESGLTVIKISNDEGEVVKEIPHKVVQTLHTYLQTNDLLPTPGKHIDKES